MPQMLWRVTVSSLFPNDNRVEIIYEGHHVNEEAAREAALSKEAADHGGSSIPTVTKVEVIGDGAGAPPADT